MSDSLKRSHSCGLLTKEAAGEQVVLCGWVAKRRDHGGLIFVDLRDRSGIVQIVVDPDDAGNSFTTAEAIRSEYVIKVAGKVRLRDAATVNPNLATGEIEVVAADLEVLNAAKTPPFYIQDDIDTDENLRLKYRYLDLRRPEMQKNLILRHKVTKLMRDYMDKNGFCEIETPMLTKSTPEGARDYLVPSRVNPGKFYALPQSPQIFKQILMVAGMERYFQIARCFRDEDLRADRQPEFTQLDIEMSFVDFKVFNAIVEDGGVVKAINVKGYAAIPRRELDGLVEFVGIYGAKGLAWMQIQEDGSVKSPIAKFFSEAHLANILKTAAAEPGDLILFVADKPAVVAQALGALRLEMAKRRELIDEDMLTFAWVVDFPMFEYNDEEKRYVAMHHPFTAPRNEDLAMLATDPGKVYAKAYDMVLNGTEIGGGSIRIHRRDVQNEVFKAIGLTEEQAKEKFGFMMDAFEYGAPPHGGLAFGLDRLIMIMAKRDSIRDVIAFPKTQSASCLMTQAPNDVDEKQLRELHIRATLVKKDK